jgi:hypothetical protein
MLLSVLIFIGSRFLGTGVDDQAEQSDVLPTAVIAPSSTPTPTSQEDTKNGKAKEEEKTETPTPSAPAKKSSDTSLNRSSLKIQVLNGSGISGAAGKMSATLNDLGYTNVTTGNADAFDHEDISISVKSTKANFLELLEKDLSDSYTIGDTDSKLVSDQYDAVIIIGQ